MSRTPKSDAANARFEAAVAASMAAWQTNAPNWRELHDAAFDASVEVAHAEREEGVPYRFEGRIFPPAA